LAVSSAAESAEANGFEAVGNFTLQEQDAFVTPFLEVDDVREWLEEMGFGCYASDGVQRLH